MIKTLTDKHPSQVVKKNKMAFCSWIASRLAKDFKDYPDLDLKCMMNIFRNSYVVLVPNTKLYRARCMAKSNIVETHATEFVIIHNYAHMVLKTNLRSVAKIKSKLLHRRTPPIFERLFIFFHESVVGFEGHS